MMAKLPSKNSVITTARAIETDFTPQLLIPCEAPYRDESRHHFPCVQAIRARRAALDVRLVEEFKTAISIAQQVWIIDRYLFSADGQNPDHSRRLEQVEGWFRTENIKSIKILTGHHGAQKEIEEAFEKLREDLTKQRARHGSALTVTLSFALRGSDCIHDRFAIIDNELWHFGATVGGFHRDVNAVSRGWNAEAHDAVRFFDTVWNMVNANGRK